MKVRYDTTHHNQMKDYPSANKVFLLFFFFARTDNVLVTENGYENLTTVPKEVAQIEGIISPSV